MIVLADYQRDAVAFMVNKKRALVQSPAGSGKTIMAAAGLLAVIKRKARATRVRVGWIANTSDQCRQAREAIAAFPELGPMVELQIECPAGWKPWEFDILIVDECHHAPAETWRSIIDAHPGAAWFFSATPFSEDEADEPRNEYLRAVCGGQVFVIPKSAVASRVLPGRVVLLDETDPNLEEPINAAIEEQLEKQIPRLVRFKEGELWADSVDNFLLRHGDLVSHVDREQHARNVTRAVAASIVCNQTQPLRKLRSDWITHRAHSILYPRVSNLLCQQMGIAPNGRRNRAIIDTALAHRESSVLVLVASIAHGTDYLANEIGTVVCHSKLGAKRKKYIAEFAAGDRKVLIATSLADEGLDVPIASTLILAGAGRKASKTEQRAGRVLRAHGNKTHGTIFDFLDNQHPLLRRQSLQRQATFRKLGYEIERVTSERTLL